MAHASKRRSLALLSLGFLLLLIAWIGATRPFGGPDESDHYLRAVGLASGHLLGPKVPWVDPTITPLQRAWVQQDTRGVQVSAALSPEGRPCVGGAPNTGNRGCIEATHTGDYQPLAYLLPALLIKTTSHASTASWVARAASALQSAAFIALALALLWNGSLWSVVGLLAAITPMVLFVGSVINPNGLEVSAALAFAAGLLRIGRDPSSVPRWVWWAMAASGAVTVLSWQLGPVFVLVELVALWGTQSLEQLRALKGEHTRAIAVTAAVTLLALAVYLVYAQAAHLLHSQFSLTPLGSNLHVGFSQLNGLVHQSVGVFGALTVGLPGVLYWVWWLFVFTLVVAAFALGNRRDRGALASVVLLALFFPVLFDAWIYHYTGFPLQGRYILPVLMLPPLVAGEIVLRHRDRMPERVASRSIAAVTAGVGLFQILAWWRSAGTAAGAGGGSWLWGHAAWSPPLGWWPWALLAAAGGAALALTALTAARGPSPAGLRAPPQSVAPRV